MSYCKQTIIDGNVLVAGDLHGQMMTLITKLDQMGWPGDHIICLGDIGLGFSVPEMQIENDLDKEAKKHDTHIWLIRGNHDNPAVWEKEHPYTNVHFLRDNTVAVINGVHWYVNGGSVSLDRIVRTEGENWWPGEELKFALPTHIDISKIYGILSHVGPTPPDNSMQVLNYYMRVSGYLIKEPLDREKMALKEMMQVLKPKEWYFGHFHASKEFVQDACKCHCLDELIVQQMGDVLVGTRTKRLGLNT